MDSKLRLALLAFVFMLVAPHCHAQREVQIILSPYPSSGSAGCNGATPTGCTFRESFEGSAACWSGSTYTNCDVANQWVNTFSGASTVYNYATAPAPLQGTHSLAVTGGGNAQAGFTANSTMFMGVIFNFQTFSDFNNHIQLTDASFNTLCAAEIPSGSTVFTLINTGGSSVNSSSGITIGTWYIQLEGIVGTGANATCKLLYSSTGASGSWTTLSSTNGTWTANPAGVEVVGNNTNTLIFDDFRAYTAQMNWN